MLERRDQGAGGSPALAAATRAVALIAVHSGLGASDAGTARGPARLREAGAESWLAGAGLPVLWHDVRPDPARRGLAAMADLSARLAERIETVLARGQRFVVLGGDHAAAIGTWSGGHRAMKGRGRLGLMWIDAHLDAHIPATSPSGNWHGMPLAYLLGHGARELTALARPGSALAADRLCLIGARSWEEAERALLARLGVRVMTMAEVNAIGLRRAVAEALATAARGTAGFGVSLDLDAVDPGDAPGVGSPVAGGMKAEALAQALAGLGCRPDFVGLEIVEFNPLRDRQGRTADVVRRLLSTVFSKEAEHE